MPRVKGANRLVKVRSAKTGNATIQTAEFDGTGRRIKKVVTNTGEFDATTVFYFDLPGNIIESRNGAGNTMHQAIATPYNLPCLGRIFAIIPPDPCPPQQPPADSKPLLFVYHDAHGNPLILTNQGGSVVERYVYSPYGDVMVHQETGLGDYDGDQDVDGTDRTAISGACGGPNPTGPCRILDLNGDGTVDSDDDDCFVLLPQGTARHPGLGSSGVGHSQLYQSLWFDPEIRMLQNVHRQYAPSARRFLQRDPLTTAHCSGHGYGDGLSLYAFVRGNPIRYQDPLGTWVTSMNTLSSPIQVVVNTVFWGVAGNATSAILGQAELESAWNGEGSPDGALNFRHATDPPNTATRSAQFSFPSEFAETAQNDGVSYCCNVSVASCEHARLSPCYDALESHYPTSLFVYALPQMDCPSGNDPGCSDGYRNAGVAANYIGNGCSHQHRLLAHEVGHAMGGCHANFPGGCRENDVNDEPQGHPFWHIMVSHQHTFRAAACHNITDVINRHMVTNHPASGIPPVGPWSCP